MITKQDLVGSWLLESWAIGYESRDLIGMPFGEDPEGLLVYTEQDWMSAAINHPEREVFPEPGSPRAQDDATLARAYRTYFHYAGRYQVRGNDVIHYVTQHTVPNLVGTEQLRHAELNGNTLVLSGREMVGGEVRYHTLVWHRAAASHEDMVIND